MQGDWNMEENEQVTLSGTAENAKAGPLLLIDGTDPILLTGISEWADDTAGKQIVVEAIVRRERAFPAMDHTNEEEMQGTASGGDQWVLEVKSFRVTE
jgi:hypothetical protein